MRFHAQNLNEKPHGRMGWMLWRGRAWWHLSDRTMLHAEWSARPSLQLGAQIQSGGMGDDHVLANVSLFGLTLYFGVSCPLTRRLSSWASKREGFETGVEFQWGRYHSTPTLRIDIASRIMSWRSSDPRWVRGWNIDIADLLLGSRVYSREVLKSVETVIPMPEGCYAASIELDICRWKRPRWPFALTQYGSKVDIPGGIPFAGKGENSWDCGDDGLWGSNPAAETVEDAIAAIVASVLKSRRRYGHASFLQGVPPVMARPAPSTPTHQIGGEK
jgi:hypothetical protein